MSEQIHNIYNKFSFKSVQRGQALLIIVLVMVVTMTIALSVATRSIINLRSSSEEESSQKAFSAAEAGIERAITTASPITNAELENKALYNVSIDPVGNSSEFMLENGASINKNEGTDIWLQKHEDNGTIIYGAPGPWSGKLQISWGENAGPPCSNGAIEVFVLSGTTPNSPNISHYAFDRCGSRPNGFFNGIGAGNNGLNDSTPPGGPKVIDITSGWLVRVIPLYQSTKISVKVLSGPILPLQGNTISSTGTSGETKRKISLYKTYPKLPAEMFYTLLSP